MLQLHQSWWKTLRLLRLAMSLLSLLRRPLLVRLRCLSFLCEQLQRVGLILMPPPMPLCWMRPMILQRRLRALEWNRGWPAALRWMLSLFDRRSRLAVAVTAFWAIGSCRMRTCRIERHCVCRYLGWIPHGEADELKPMHVLLLRGSQVLKECYLLTLRPLGQRVSWIESDPRQSNADDLNSSACDPRPNQMARTLSSTSARRCWRHTRRRRQKDPPSKLLWIRRWPSDAGVWADRWRSRKRLPS